MDDHHPAGGDDLRSRSIRSATVLLLGQAIRFVLLMLSQVFLARLLFPSDFGIFAMVTPLLGFVQVFSDFGLLQALIQRPTISPPLVNTVFWLNLLISAILSLVFVALTPVLVLFYGEPRLWPIGLVSSLLILVTGLGQTPAALLTRRLWFGTSTVIDLVSQAAGVAAGICGALLGWGYWSLVLSAAVSTCSLTTLSFVLVRWVPSRPNGHHEAWGMLRFGSQVTGSKVVTYVNSSADNLIVGGLLGSVSLGLYDRAWRLAAVSLSQLCAPLDRLALPVLSRVLDDPERYRRAFTQMAPLLCLVAMPSLLFGAVAADRVIPTLLGPHWTGAVPVFRWVCVGAIISPLNNATFWLMVSQSRGRDLFRGMAVAAVVNVSAYLIGARWSLTGVAMASAISVYLLQFPVLIWIATRSGPVSLGQFLSCVRPPLGAVALGSPLLIYLARDVLPKSWIGLGLGGLASYALTASLLCLTPSGRRTLLVTWNLAPSKVRLTAAALLGRRAIIRGEGN